MNYIEMEMRPILETMKWHIKKNDIKYKDLAEGAGLSLASINRLLNSHTISLKQLVHLCELCGLTLSELMRKTDKFIESTNYMTEEQDVAFNEDLSLQMYMTELFFLGNSPDDIEKRYNLSPSSTVKYLRKLENLNILRIGLNNTYTFLIRCPWEFRPGGKCMMNHGRQRFQRLYEKVFECVDLDSNKLIHMRSFKLTDEQYQNLSSNLNDLLNRYARISKNQSSSKAELTSYTLGMLGDEVDIYEGLTIRDC